MPGLKGLATGIGSLPYDDVEYALELIFRYLPQIPFWPQLPKRDTREGMLSQFSENLPCLKMAKDGLSFDGHNKERELEVFYERIIAQDIEYFKISRGFALGLHRFYQRLEKAGLEGIECIKCQVTGPFTFAASLKDDTGIALLHDKVFMQAILKGLTMKALWQIRTFRKFDKKIIMFLDEPYLGCFGSAHAAINREEVISGLSEISAAIKTEGVLAGIHCCGNTDWAMFTEINGIDIINFDAFGFLERFLLYADNIKDFLKRGGIICWGIVPTQEFIGQNADSLLNKIEEGLLGLTNKGVDRKPLLENLLLSPSCGLGTLEGVQAEKILVLLRELSSLIRKNR